ncbi:MAG: hypothetical protein KGJ06_06850 [Pseudomonadota bacterium]|nr:hypothetical protein [Pseudomonadota bacterium]
MKSAYEFISANAQQLYRDGRITGINANGSFNRAALEQWVSTQADTIKNAFNTEVLPALQQTATGAGNALAGIGKMFQGLFSNTGGAVGSLGGAAGGFMLGNSMGGPILGIILALIGLFVGGGIGNQISGHSTPPGPEPVLRPLINGDLARSGGGIVNLPDPNNHRIVFLDGQGQVIRGSRDTAHPVPEFARYAVLVHMNGDNADRVVGVSHHMAINHDRTWAGWHDWRQPGNNVPDFIQNNQTTSNFQDWIRSFIFTSAPPLASAAQSGLPDGGMLTLSDAVLPGVQAGLPMINTPATGGRGIGGNASPAGLGPLNPNLPA